MIFTSCTKNIRADCDCGHTVKALDPDKSWKLFLKTILCEQEEFPKDLKEKGKDILKNCGGVPLVIKEVGKQIAEKRQSGGEWEEILDSIDFDSTLKLFESSLNHLEPEPRSCFPYLAFFKENITMRGKMLEQLWAAGGLVSEPDQIEWYLFKLYDESIIELKERRKYLGIRSYLINTVLHRLSIKKAEEEINLEILRKDRSNQPCKKPRHRVLKCSREKFDYSTNQERHLVSLFFHGGGYFESSPSYWQSFEELKILDLEDFGINILPETIGTLKEIRYMGLRNNYIQKLPHSFGRLKKLQVLDLALNFMVELPDILWEMDSLLHLYMSDMICRKPLRIEAVLEKLETLTYISFDDWIYELSHLRMMTSLRKLGIEGLDANSDVRKIFECLAELRSVQYLILRGFHFRCMPCLDDLSLLNHLVTRLPTLDCFPRRLDQLKLVNTRLDEDPMPVLEKLPKLSLLLLQNAYTGQRMVILQDGFPMLTALYIENLWNLRNLQVGEGGLSHLARLEINNCPYMETLLKKFESITGLKSFKMVTTKKIETKVRKSSLISKIEDVDINP